MTDPRGGRTQDPAQGSSHLKPDEGEVATKKEYDMTEQQQIPTSEVLNRAADLIEERGLWKGGTTSGTCAANAISKAARGETYLHPAHYALLAYLGRDRSDGLRPIFVWNDAPGRTAAEVIEVLRAAAVIEAARERSAADERAASAAVQS